jgi:hypothetical protein
MHRYQKDLTRGHVSSDIFPTTFKRLKKADVLKKGGTWQSCADCKAEFGLFENVGRAVLCPECRNRETEETCFLCDRRFPIRVSQTGRVDGRKPICHECRVQVKTEQCRNCGQLFEVTASDRAFFKSKVLSLPKRCASCRKQKRTGSPAASSSEASEGLLDMLVRWLKS